MVARAGPEADSWWPGAVRLDGCGVLRLSLLLVRRVKHARRRGRTRISAKNQATIPAAALRQSGLKVGDELRVEAAGAGRIVLARADDPIERYKGCLTGVYPKDYLDRLRREWR